VPPNLVDALDLETWANRRDAEGLLPELIVRLIYATNSRITRFHFPFGEGVRQRGADGMLIAEEGTDYVPLGASTWEVGAGADPRRKANDDYRDRRDGPFGKSPSDAAFVFVTARRWDGHEDWAETKSADGRWREVRAYDAHDLEAWLLLAPVVHVWISRIVGKPVASVRSLDDYWASWQSATRPQLSEGFLLAGRAEAADELLGRVTQGPALVPLKADSIDEAVGFLAASLHRLGTGERDKMLSRALLVKDEDAWNWAVHAGERLLLVPIAPDLPVSDALRAGHDVVVPVGRDVPSRLADAIVVPRLDRTTAAAALQEAGVSEPQAARLAMLGRRNLVSMRRSIAAAPTLERPDWAEGVTAHGLLAPSLCGSWDEARDGDRAAIAAIAGESYDVVSARVTRWSNDVDPPLRRIGTKWYVVNKEDVWILLAPTTTTSDLDRFASVAVDVLRTLDPALRLPPDEAWRSGMPEYTRPHSALLREGIAGTLALIASMGDEVSIPGAATCQSYVDGVVRRVLQWDDGEIQAGWSSLSDVLPLLAEASPDVFLDAADYAVSRNSDAFVELLRDPDGSVLFATSHHTGLLWGLENIAWSPRLLGRVALTLARLAALDPDGRWANRPGNTLRDVMLLWKPQTSASLDERLRVLDALRDAGLGWDILMRLLPRSHDTVSPSHAPRWRPWKPETQEQVAIAEWMRGIREVTERVLEDVGTDPDRWSRVIKRLSDLPADIRSRVIDRLEGQDHAVFASESVREELREVVSRHRRYNDAEWAMPKDDVDRLDRILEAAAPIDPVLRHAWLFTHRPDLVDVDDSDWTHYRDAVTRARQDAARSIVEEAGLAAAIDLAARVDVPWDLGRGLGAVPLSEEDERELLSRFGESDGVDRMIAGYVAARFDTSGWAWIEGILGQDAPAPQRAAMLGALPQGPDVWARVAAEPEEVRTAFWSAFLPWGLGEEPDYLIAVQRLLEYERPFAAIEALGIYRQPAAPTSVLVQALSQAASSRAPENLDVSMLAHHVGELLDELERRPDADDPTIAALEWAYLPLLRHEERGTPVLHNEMRRNPAFFVELVCAVYRSNDDVDREPTEDERNRAEVAWQLLNSWHDVPGGSSDGSLDGDSLSSWVDEARRLLGEQGRRDIGDDQIGRVLRYAPQDADGAWPHRAVRDILEHLASPPMEEGLEVEVFNSRGVTSRGLRDGGEQERTLVDRYLSYASTTEGRWPRTTRVLRRIADTFEHDARRHDLEVESREELWGD
jgi:hypothetical protein